MFNSYKAYLAGHTGLKNITAFSELKPLYFNATQQVEKHNAAVWHYLWSFSSNAPLITGTKKLVHDQGAYTKEPSDDNFKEANR